MTTDVQPGQIPCPSCGRLLALPIEAVLAARPIVCGACGLELTADRETSREALDQLGGWYEETLAARASVESGHVSANPDGPSRRRRRRGR